MSQEQLGEQLGVTFQQVQKYEKGSNRISASRLWQIAEILDVPVAFFFEGTRTSAAQNAAGFAEDRQAEITGIANSTESLQLLRYFTHIIDPKVRRSVVDLTRSLASAEPAVGEVDETADS